MNIFSLSPTSLAHGAERPSTPAERRRGLLFVSAACRRVVSMRRMGKAGIGLLAVVALLALSASSALAATTITVTETTDAPLASGATTCESTDPAEGCTLRAAVELADAEGGEVTIDVPAGNYKESATDPTLVIENDAEVTISGAGAENTIIEGEAKARVLEVEEDSSLTIDGVTVTNGAQEEDGGGIDVADFAALLVEDSTITENSARYGGGIYGGFLAEIAVVGSTIDENVAESEGGGIFGEEGSYVLVKGSKITKNRAHEDGGGIASDPESRLLVEQSTVADNEAEYGGGIEAYLSEETCEDTAHGGTASHTPSVRKSTANDEPEPNVTIEQSTIERNDAQWGGGIATYEDHEARCGVRGAARKSSAHSAGKSVRPQAGLIELEPGILIEQSTIASNRAEELDESGGYGGGIYEEGSVDDPIVNSTIAENFAKNDGGGIEIADGASAALVSDTVFDNTVEPEEIEIQGKSARRALHRDVVEGTVGPGSNLATEDEDAYMLLRNTIVAEPSASTENCEGNLYSLEEKAGYNLDYPSKVLPGESLDTCGMSSEEQDLVGEAPGLDEGAGLASNGGPTQTIALLSSSPAIGFVPLSEDCDEAVFGPAGVDQRGLKRPGIAGKGCDIGAYEYQEPAKQEVKTEEKAPAPAPTPAPQPASAVLSVKITSPVQCASKRDITIHIQNVRNFGIVSAVVSIDGHDKKTLSAKHLIAGINLRGLPPGTFTVEIVAHTHSGHTLRGERVYHTCHTKLPGHSYLRL
jgi:hypothetical protein